MCNFHSSIVAFVDDEIKIYHTNESSHHVIADRAGLTDEMYKARLWLRVECQPSEKFKFELDEVGELPEWYTANEKEIKRRVRSLARSAHKIDKQIAPIRGKCDKQIDTIWAEYNKQIAPIWAEYNKQIATIRAECDKQIATIRAERDKQIATIWAERDKQIDIIRAERDKQIAPIRTRLKTLESWVE